MMMKCLVLNLEMTLYFDGGRGRGGAMVVNGNAGVDPCILRHQITDLQQDVTCVPGEEEEQEKRERRDKGEEEKEGGTGLAKRKREQRNS